MMNRSGDLKLGFGPIHVSFSCDGEFVTFQVYRNDEALGSPEQLSRADAVRKGQQIEASGHSDYLPAMSPSDVRLFGARLRTYGEDGK
jgi:hypothetical protein